MKNEIRFTLKSKQRPKLAQEIGNILGTAPHYERVPSCAYDIAGYRLDKEGVLHIPDGAEKEIVEELIRQLREHGFQDDMEITEEVLVQQDKLTIAITKESLRVLRPGESVRADGKYQYKYHIDGKPHFVYSWKLEPTDKLPKGKKPCLSLRELEKQVNTDLDLLVNIVDGQMTVCELVDRYLKTKTGVRQSTKQGYVTVQRLLAKEAFGKKTIRSVKTSDAKLFLIKLQQEDRKSYSSIHTIRGVLRPAFQMAVDDDILVKNPFGFQLAGVLVNDAVTREAITKDQMRKFLKFVHDDVVYCKYYEVVYILFYTGMRIS